MNSQLTKAILSIILATIFFSCGENKKQFTVEGTINNADTLTLYLEKRGHSDITVLDSVKLDAKGDFSFKEDALGYSEFYRLRLAEQSINFSVDSTEVITITADKANFATGYNVEGSKNSNMIKDAALWHLELSSAIKTLQNQLASKMITNEQFTHSADILLNVYKERAKVMIFENLESTAAYFSLFQKIEDMLIFDPSDKKDLQLYRAVATVWNSYRAESPRTLQLNNYTLSAIASIRAEENRQTTLNRLMNGETTDNKEFFAVSLPDINNKLVSTTDLMGKVVVLDFTSYRAEFSLAHNVRLNGIYEKYKSKMEIYQVAFDGDKHAWQNSATNIPWICVRDEKSAASPLLPKFNVEELPTTFILNKDGELIKKLTAKDDIASEVAKVL